MVRASGSYPLCQGFESLHRHHFPRPHFDRLIEVLDTFLRSEIPFARGDRLLVGFSGGPDSLALLAGLEFLRPALCYELRAAHLDHGLDPDSGSRARQAALLAAKLGVPCEVERRRPSDPELQRRGIEDAGRRLRYRYLAECRERLSARWLLTAHHHDDQVETVLLRLVFGTGVEGLGAMPARKGRLARPLLSLHRHELTAALDEIALEPVVDPTNFETSSPRARIRHLLRPHLEAESPGLSRRLVALAGAARAAGDSIRHRLDTLNAAPPLLASLPWLADVQWLGRELLSSLPPELRVWLLAAAHRRAGARYPAPGPARRELERQLGTPHRIGCDCGDGWRWDDAGRWLTLWNKHRWPDVFTYTCSVPGSARLPDVSLFLRARRRLEGETSSRRPARCRAILAFPAASRELTVRSAAASDRLRLPGRSGARSVRAALRRIGIPAQLARRWPVISIAGSVAWVPGLGVDRNYTVSPQLPHCSIEVEITSLPPDRPVLGLHTLLAGAGTTATARASAPDDREVDDL